MTTGAEEFTPISAQFKWAEVRQGMHLERLRAQWVEECRAEVRTQNGCVFEFSLTPEEYGAIALVIRGAANRAKDSL
jgi:hypothetical protein